MKKEEGKVKAAILSSGQTLCYEDCGETWKNPLTLSPVPMQDGSFNIMFIPFLLFTEKTEIKPIDKHHVVTSYIIVDESLLKTRRVHLDRIEENRRALKSGIIKPTTRDLHVIKNTPH